MMKMSECSRCGNCCYLIDLKTQVQTNVPCPFLILNKDGTSKCKTYFRNRVGRNIGMGNKCCYRKDVKFNYPGCSLNVEGQVFIESVRE
jgi:hypothetical protein